jgi:hypothetical protein
MWTPGIKNLFLDQYKFPTNLDYIRYPELVDDVRFDSFHFAFDPGHLRTGGVGVKNPYTDPGSDDGESSDDDLKIQGVIKYIFFGCACPATRTFFLDGFPFYKGSRIRIGHNSRAGRWESDFLDTNIGDAVEIGNRLTMGR